MYADAACDANVARFAFFNPAARRFYAECERMARFAVGALRIEAGKHPHDRDLSNLIAELPTRSDAFRVAGDLELDQETLSLPDESGLSVVVYSAPPGSAVGDGL